MRRNSKAKNMNLLYLRSVVENRQAPPLSQRPVYGEAYKELVNLQKERREQPAPFIPVGERQCSKTRLILHCKSTLSG